MNRKVYLFLFFLIWTLLPGNVARALACPLYDSTPSICEMYGKSGAIFTGTIVDIKERKDEKTANFDEIYFQAKETFLGVKKGSRLKVRFNAGLIEYCGLEIGKSYIVYAYKDSQNNLNSDGGTRTRLLTEAGEDLEFLRDLRGKGSGSRIYGTIRQVSKSSLEKDFNQPASALTLKIEQRGGENQTFEAVTDSNGNYEVSGIPAGEYYISPNLVDNVNYSTGGTSVRVNDKGCVKQDFEIQPTNQIAGRVVDAEGLPVGKVSVEAIPIGYTRPVYDIFDGSEKGETDGDGNFTISNVPPGQYILAVNHNIPPDVDSPFPTIFYPNTLNRAEAIAVEISLGQKVDSLELRLPVRLAKKQITGSVAFADGKPAGGVTVYLKEDEYSICCVMKEVKTNTAGNFVLTGYEGRKYRIWTYTENSSGVGGSRKFIGVSPVFVLNDGLAAFSIALKSTTKDSLKALEEIEDGERKISH